MIGIWNDFQVHHEQLLGGLGVSLQLALLTLLLGLPGGLLLAIASSGNSKIVRIMTVTLVETGRGMPALVMLQLIYGVSLTLSAFLAAAVALGLTTASYTSEIIRGGLQAVPEGQVEAAYALGLSKFEVLRGVVIPQGLRIALPPVLAFSILMFQATSLAFVIAVQELMAQAKTIAETTFHYFNLYVIAGVLYAVITISASLIVERSEKRLQRQV